MIRVLHIVPFEKYIDSVIDLWDQTTARCEYVCIEIVDKSKAYSFSDRIQQISRDQFCAKLVSSEYDVIVFSSLPCNMYGYVQQIPEDKIIIWQSVGYDIYADNYPYPAVVNLPVYRQVTKAYINSIQRKSPWLQVRHIIVQTIKILTTIEKIRERRNIERRAQNEQKEVLSRIDYVSTVLDPEYDLLKMNPNIRADFFRFKYTLPFKESYNQYLIDFPMTKYLLIGNSGDETNNHLDVLSILKQRNITTPLYLSLAYGGEKAYVEKVVEQVNYNPGNIIQTTFMEREKYLEVLHQCRAAVFGHIRQQALGNIYVMLAQGCKVFLYKESVIYKYFKEIGLHIYSIEEDLTQETIDAPLTNEQIQLNRTYIESEYNETLSAFQKDVKEIENLVNERKKNAK